MDATATASWTPEEIAAGEIRADIFLLSKQVYIAAQLTGDLDSLTAARESLIAVAAELQDIMATEVRGHLDQA